MKLWWVVVLCLGIGFVKCNQAGVVGDYQDSCNDERYEHFHSEPSWKFELFQGAIAGDVRRVYQALANGACADQIHVVYNGGSHRLVPLIFDAAPQCVLLLLYYGACPWRSLSASHLSYSTLCAHRFYEELMRRRPMLQVMSGDEPKEIKIGPDVKKSIHALGILGALLETSDWNKEVERLFNACHGCPQYLQQFNEVCPQVDAARAQSMSHPLVEQCKTAWKNAQEVSNDLKIMRYTGLMKKYRAEDKKAGSKDLNSILADYKEACKDS